MNMKILILVLALIQSSILQSKILNQSLDSTFDDIEAALKSSDKGVETQLCFASIEKSTRDFLYRRFAGLVYQEPTRVQESIENKFALMSYLACRESGGRVVAQVAHGIESKNGAYHYGRTYAQLKKALMDLVDKRLIERSKKHFDETTNGGLFQVSADQIDNIPHELDPTLEVTKYFYARVMELDKLSKSSLLKTCGTHEYYNVEVETDIPQALEDSVDWIKNYLEKDAPKQEKWFRRVDELVWFHQLQTLCPDLNLELAKRIHHYLGGKYCGPLNNTKNSSSCGKVYSLCMPIYQNITYTLNQF